MKILFFCLALILTAACASPKSAGGEITVSAAASLQEAFREIGAVYERKTGAKVYFNFAASGALQKQIEGGAPADVFASAGKPQMNALAEKNLITPETHRDFAKNALVLILPKNANPTNAGTFRQLVEIENFRIAVGNPKTVPAGQYAEQVLRKFGAWEKAQPRLIFAEDVRQVLDYVARGEVEAGIVYASDVKAVAEKVRVADIAPDGSHEPILYPIAVIGASKNPEKARAFVELVLSAEGQAILEKYGFQKIK